MKRGLRGFLSVVFIRLFFLNGVFLKLSCGDEIRTGLLRGSIFGFGRRSENSHHCGHGVTDIPLFHDVQVTRSLLHTDELNHGSLDLSVQEAL
jgi:hypothetical protein